MTLKSVELKRTYSSDYDDILHEFYIPALRESNEYNRLAGFFSSGSLAISVRGILSLIKNGGYMKLIVSPKLSRDDVKAILDGYEHPEKYIEQKMIKDLEKIEDLFIKDHISVLGWMVANKKLELRVAVGYDEERKLLSYDAMQERCIFHQKVGILKDSDGNAITFSGSVNETAMGWLENIEEFKVFRNWIKLEREYVDADIEKFSRFWDNQSPRVKVIDLPYAVRSKLIEFAPNDITHVDLERWYQKSQTHKMKKITLYEYQKSAVEAWLKNGMRGIFEMATGTGKTFTALQCLNSLTTKTKKLITIITCPYQHLIMQWENSIDKFGINIRRLIADSTNPDWRKEFIENIYDIKNDVRDKLIVLTSHPTFSSDDFTKIIKKYTENTDITLFLIADEVHGVGAEKRKVGLSESYTFRLGLSATPKRWFDDLGTQGLYDYFKDVVFQFTLCSIPKLLPLGEK